jgi:hypothetical protein
MQQALPEGGVWLPEQKKRMEIIDEATADVWVTVDEVTQEQFDEFLLPRNWRKVGRAAGAMDQALFRHSPNGERTSVREQRINDLGFINVARPAAPSPSSSGLIEIMVKKAHVLGFDAGRHLSILHFNDAHYVEVVGDDKNDSALPLKNGASIEQISLPEPWVCELPDPSKTLWAFKPELRSFQGPVELPKNII